MIRFLSSSLMVLGLIIAVPALAQEPQAFDFDFDQQSDGTLVTRPADTSREPITAPARPADNAAPGAGAAPLPPTVPVKAETPAVTRDKDGVIVVIGEPDPPAAQGQPLSEDELYNLFAAPEPGEVTLTPEGLPPTTSVPAGPGEARVEKSKETPSAAVKTPKKSKADLAKASETKPSAPASARAGSKPSAKSPGGSQAKTAKPAAPAKRSAIGDTLVKRGDLYYHQWYLAQKAWSRVGTVVSPQIASLVPNRPLYPIDRAGRPIAAPAKTGRVYTDQYSNWRTMPVVEITRFP